MTGFPSAKAVAAALIGFIDSIALTLRRGQTTPLFSVPRPRPSLKTRRYRIEDAISVEAPIL